jgi:hypothetical protein
MEKDGKWENANTIGADDYNVTVELNNIACHRQFAVGDVANCSLIARVLQYGQVNLGLYNFLKPQLQ